ncbi:hypothetical protein BDW60DRAFT_129071 [Aspergillus nidulans var. acristatus]
MQRLRQESWWERTPARLEHSDFDSQSVVLQCRPDIGDRDHCSGCGEVSGCAEARPDAPPVIRTDRPSICGSGVVVILIVRQDRLALTVSPPGKNDDWQSAYSSRAAKEVKLRIR